MSDRLKVPRSRRQRIEDLVEKLIAELDQLEPDLDLEEDDPPEDGGDDEPSLGATGLINQEKAWAWAAARADTDLEFDGDTRACADAEPSLGSLEQFGYGNQERWAAGTVDDREDEHDGCEPDEDEPELGSLEWLNQERAWQTYSGWGPQDGEPSLGGLERLDQRWWSSGSRNDREPDARTAADVEAGRARVKSRFELDAGAAGNRAERKLREIVRRKRPLPARDRDEVVFLDEPEIVNGVRIVGRTR